MSWVQVKTPNLNVQTSMGMCLKYVQDAFGSGWAGSYALQGWRDIVKKKHANRNIPGGVYVPIWFEGYWNGVNYGHVAIYKDGVVWSSPYTNKRTHDRLGSIAEVERIYGMKFIGWSEDIGGTTVIKKQGVIMAVIKDVNNEWGRWRKLAQQIRGRDFTRDEFRRSAVGLTWLRAMEVLSDNAEADRNRENAALGKMARKDNWQKQIYDLQAQVKALGGRPTQAQVDDLNKQLTLLSAQMKDAQAEATQARKDAVESAKALETIEGETAQAKKEADNFLTALINAVRKMFGK